MAAIRATYRLGRCDLFGCPDVGLRQSNILLGAGYLALMPLRKSLVHNSLSVCFATVGLPLLYLAGLRGHGGLPGWNNPPAANRKCRRPISPFRSSRSTRSIR